jgi:hypothetical protein
LNPFDKHFVDRDLMRTGLSIILITPGVGKFFVNKKLLRLTNERMTDNGIAMDLVCLSSVPLHITPLMCFMDAPLTFETEPTNAEPFSGDTLMPRIGKPFTAANSPEKAGISNLKLTSGYLDPLYRDTKDAPTQKYYVVPHWVDCSFYHHETGRFIKQDKFKTRCKMYELQMMGIMEHDIKGIRIPYLSETVTKEPPKTRTIKQQRSSSSLNDRLALTSSDGKHNNGEHYLSKSANIGGSTRRTSFLSNAEMIMTPKPEEKTDAVFTRYDSNVFKTSNEPRFGKRHSIQTKLSNNLKSSHAPKSSFEGSERPDSDGLHVTSTRHKTSNVNINIFYQTLMY